MLTLRVMTIGRYGLVQTQFLVQCCNIIPSCASKVAIIRVGQSIHEHYKGFAFCVMGQQTYLHHLGNMFACAKTIFHFTKTLAKPMRPDIGGVLSWPPPIISWLPHGTRLVNKIYGQLTIQTKLSISTLRT